MEWKRGIKTPFFYFLLIPFLYINQRAASQEACKVLMPSIAGTYEGSCKKGKASGEGKAEGTDQYSGEFKEGLPHGKGIYRWKNGNFYQGDWVRGQKEGNGGMAYKRPGKPDSIVTGFWKKDIYIAKYEKPFKLYHRTMQVTQTDVKFTVSPTNEINIMLSNTTGNMPNLNGTVTPRAILEDVSIAVGSFVRMVNLFENHKQTAYKLEQVTFPFRAIFRIGDQEVDMEFLEDGKYTMEIALNN
ncbi:hypothetical protein GZH53_15920 [Flavihumibacter sp. R14]|nr:hypothetical protein [Flavihumibacter soli]